MGVSIVENSVNYIDFEQARTTLDYAGDIEPRDSTVSGHLVQHLPAEGGGRLFWSRDGALRFHDRYYDMTQSTTITIDDDELEEFTTANGAQLANAITVNYAVRQLGTPATKIAEATNLPIKVTQGSYKNFTLRYRDFVTDAQISADDVITPVVGVDVICYDGESGGSVDNDFIGIGVDRVGAREIVFSVNNPSSSGDPRSKDRWIHTLQVRGTPLYAYDRQSATLIDGDSITDNGKYALQLNYQIIDDATFAESLARYQLKRYAQSMQAIDSITFSVHVGNIGMLSDIDIASILTINSTQENVSDEYVVIGQEWQAIADGSQRSMVTMHVKPLNREPVAIASRAIVNLANATVAL